MTQKFYQDFVYLSYRSLGPDCSAKLGFHHRKSSFDVRTLMVVGQKLSPVQVVIVVRALPQAISLVVASMANRN